MREREGMAALGELAAGMAHELRNALATIRGYLRLLPGADGARRTRYLDAIEGEAETLSGVLDRTAPLWRPLNRLQFRFFRHATDRGHEFFALARKPER